MIDKRTVLTTVVLGVAALAGCQRDVAGVPGSALAEGCLQIDDGWARAPLPGQMMTAGYGRLSNRCSVDIQLVAVEGPAGISVALHRTEIIEGVSQMRAAGAVGFKPGQALPLMPGGWHLMLHGLGGQVGEGDDFDLVLLDSRGGRSRILLPVRREAPLSR